LIPVLIERTSLLASKRPLARPYAQSLAQESIIFYDENDEESCCASEREKERRAILSFFFL
jgi:hypothetical protein